jgi:hypothetical protein
MAAGGKEAFGAPDNDVLRMSPTVTPQNGSAELVHPTGSLVSAQDTRGETVAGSYTHRQQAIRAALTQAITNMPLVTPSN